MLQTLETPKEVEVDDGLSVKCILLLKISTVLNLIISSLSQSLKEKNTIFALDIWTP